MSLIIFAGIVVGLPSAIGDIYQQRVRHAASGASMPTLIIILVA